MAYARYLAFGIDDSNAIAERAIRDLIRNDWRWQMRDNPEFASQSGVHEYDHLLQDLSPKAFAERIAHDESVLYQLDKIVTSNGSQDFDADLKLHVTLFKQSVEDELAAYRLGCHLYPVNSIGYGGVHNNFIEALDWLGGDEQTARRNFVCRLSAFQQQARQFKALLKLGMAEGKVASCGMLRKIPEQFRQLANLDEGPIKSRIDAIPPEQKALRESARAAAASFRESILELEKFFEKEYIPRARETPGCLGLSAGSTVYRRCLRFHTTTSLTPEQVHSIGLQQVERIERRYETDVLRPLGRPAGSFKQFVEDVKKPDSGFYFKTEEQLLSAYKELVARIYKCLPRVFEVIPEDKLEIVRKDSPTGPAAYYMAGTEDGSRPGRFFVNVSNVTARPSYLMTALALHEAIPGHHMQLCIQLSNKNIPEFLKHLEDRRYEYCPARRQMYAAYLEGWALYCEGLGEELGIYDKDPMKIFGRLSMEMMRAVRLVVDTGIHAMGWSLSKAIAYMEAKTGMHRYECEAECYRYEAWPGQACAYKVGEVAIRECRRKAEEELGEQFSLKEFHSVVLNSGPLPLDVLSTMVDEWVADRKSRS